jgi:hypothetical protein
MEGYWVGECLSPPVCSTEKEVISRNKIFSMSTSPVIDGMQEANCIADLASSTCQSKHSSSKFLNAGNLPEDGQNCPGEAPSKSHIITVEFKSTVTV